MTKGQCFALSNNASIVFVPFQSRRCLITSSLRSWKGVFRRWKMAKGDGRSLSVGGLRFRQNAKRAESSENLDRQMTSRWLADG